MKVCPKCNKTYDDANLNFCLEDGEMLMETETVDAPPTIMMDSPRQTNENWGNFETDQSQFNQPNQQIYQQPFASPQSNFSSVSKDQTLPIISLIAGSLSIFCCYFAIIIGPAAMITGYIGMNNVNKDPNTYDGKNLAIIGMVLGGIGFALSIFWIILNIIGSIA